ncbi:MAG: lipopolysaccharide assembly protein LapB [Gammaproteobacteria bacterium]|nr:lipopolysaccharide assembly protein LapB [Gammaproteobacteria bacterium]
MIIELLWLLLPVAAASGWWAAKRSSKKRRSKYSNALSPEYYRGLNYLLNEEQDKALDVFLRLVEADSETIETHYALGGLFRRRGEVERAIRVHQNLLARPSLEATQRSIALMELAKDYMSAGLLDRAESLLLDVVKHPGQQSEALEHLLTIYQRENEWANAIKTAKKMGAGNDPHIRQTVAHCYCEIAVAANRNKLRHKAVEALQDALVSDPRSVRANILLGDLAFEEQQFLKAYRYYIRVFELDDEFVPEVLDRIVSCIDKGVAASDFDNHIRLYADKPMRNALLPGLTKYFSKSRSQESIRDYVRQQIQKAPTLPGMKEWLDLEFSNDDVNLEQIKQMPVLLNRILKKWPNYRCRQCGFQSSVLNWQCPTCKSWSTTKPSIPAGK